MLFLSTVSGTEQMELFELHVCVRDYCFAREDRLVGVAVMRLVDIADQVGLNVIIYMNKNDQTKI